MFNTPDVNEIARLQLCTQITLYDCTTSDHLMAYWCMDLRLSMRKYETVDISDFSYQHDIASTFWFTEEEDAIMFKLKWM